nr:hypothetical protein [Burkholderia aenigmatica]
MDMLREDRHDVDTGNRRRLAVLQRLRAHTEDIGQPMRADRMRIRDERRIGREEVGQGAHLVDFEMRNDHAAHHRRRDADGREARGQLRKVGTRARFDADDVAVRRADEELAEAELQRVDIGRCAKQAAADFFDTGVVHRCNPCAGSGGRTPPSRDRCDAPGRRAIRCLDSV